MNGAATDRLYFVRTAVHCYIGRLERNLDNVVIFNDVVEIYNTGPLEQMFGADGPIRYSHFPSGVRVFFQVGAIIYMAEWNQEIPPRMA